MSKYNFDEVIDRRKVDSIKWDVKENELPMWVADMDFATCPAITNALIERLQNGTYGYTNITDEWYDSYISWWDRRHGLKIKKEELIFSTGVIPSLSTAIRRFTRPNEKVLVQTPVYNTFYNSVLNNGARMIESPLFFEDNKWQINYEDLEEKLSDKQTTVMIVCNPHNPIGRIWEKDELARIGELCQKHHVLVISDEIHCDITKPGQNYTPFATASDICKNNSITLIAPSKAFNIAGMQSSAIYAPNEVTRHIIWRGLNTDECAETSFLAATAASTAFNEGEEWLDELNVYIQKNKDYVQKFIDENIDGLKMLPSDATYLCWVDCRNLTGNDTKFAAFLRETTGLFVSTGDQYGKAGEGFLRINVACPMANVVDGMNRLKKGAELYKVQN